MVSFVPENLLQNQRNNERSKPFEGRIDLLILANAKKMDLSFDELALFRVRDFLEFTDIYFGELKPSQRFAKDEIRNATQADIDQLLG